MASASTQAASPCATFVKDNKTCGRCCQIFQGRGENRTEPSCSSTLLITMRLPCGRQTPRQTTDCHFEPIHRVILTRCSNLVQRAHLLLPTDEVIRSDMASMATVLRNAHNTWTPTLRQSANRCSRLPEAFTKSYANGTKSRPFHLWFVALTKCTSWVRKSRSNLHNMIMTWRDDR